MLAGRLSAFDDVSSPPTREALSYAALDRLLGLPRGAARRRRLAALVVRASHLAGTPFHRGDRLIVEPGSALPLSRFVACRVGRRLAVYATGLTRTGEVVLLPPSPEDLPLPLRPQRAVVGIVLGAVRRSGTEVSFAPAPSYEFRSVPGGAVEFGRDEIPAELRSLNAARLEAVLRELESYAARLSPAEARAVRASAFRVRTLGRCSSAVTDRRLYEALVEEINSTLSRLQRRAQALRPCGLSPPLDAFRLSRS